MALGYRNKDSQKLAHAIASGDWSAYKPATSAPAGSDPAPAVPIAPPQNAFVYGSTDPAQQAAQGGAGASAPQDVAQSFIKGDWANPNTAYVNSGSYLDNANISERGKGAMASFARQGFNFDSVPSNVSQYSGIDKDASNEEKADAFLYNYMRNMSPEQQSATLQDIQDQYTAAGQGADVFSRYNEAVAGDNGYAAQQAQRNAAPEQGDYELSNSAQRAKVTEQRNYLQSQIDEFENSVREKIRKKYPNISDARLEYEVSMALEDELANPKSDYKATLQGIKDLDSTISTLSSAISDEQKANEKYTTDYKADYAADNFGETAEDFVRNPQTRDKARELSIDVAIGNGMDRAQAEAYTDNWMQSGIVPTDVMFAIEEYKEQAKQYDTLMRQYAEQRQREAESQRMSQMLGNRFNAENYMPQRTDTSVPSVFSYQPKF